MTWVGRDSKDHVFQSACHRQGHLSLDQLLKVPSNLTLRASSNGASKKSLDNLSLYITTLIIKISSYIWPKSTLNSFLNGKRKPFPSFIPVCISGIFHLLQEISQVSYNYQAPFIPNPELLMQVLALILRKALIVFMRAFLDEDLKWFVTL